MNHWDTVGQLGAGRRADMERDAAGGVRMRAAGRPSRKGRRLLNGLRLVLTALVAHGRHLPMGPMPRAGEAALGAKGPWRYQDAGSTER